MVRIKIGEEELTLSWEQWEHRVRTGRVTEDTLVQFEPVTGDAWVHARDLEMFNSLRESAVLAFQGAGAPPIITALLVGLNIRLWWAQEWVVPINHGVLAKCLAAHSPVMEDGEGWRLLTMGFCHTDFFHIAMNMLWLAVAGWGVERALGRLNLVVIYIASVLGGSLLSVLLAPEISALGASGGVYGVVSAVVVFGFLRPHLLPENRRGLYGIAMLPYLVIMFVGGLGNDAIANWAHFGGLISGGALAMVLDPAQLQRRPHWNAGWQSLVGGAVALSILAPLVAGPRMHVLVDEKEARSQQSRIARVIDDDKPEPYRPLEYKVPAGWAPRTNSAGDAAFMSRVWDSNRTWSVTSRSENRPTTPADVLARWRTRLEKGWPDAKWAEPEPTEVAGHDGLTATAFLGEGDHTRTLQWWGTTRGIHTLQIVWEVDDPAIGRLKPLRDRLLATIVWRDPDDLHDANREITHNPRSRTARAMLARAVARIGDGPQSVDLWLALIAEDPNKRDYWDGLLETLVWYPQHPQAEALWTRALVERPTPRTARSVVLCLDAAGRAEDGDGLIDLAWAKDPGDRGLKRTRRGRGQSTALDAQTNLPWESVNSPVDGSRLEPTLPPETLTLEDAAVRGQELKARAALVEQAAIAWIQNPEASELPVSLLFLRFGEVPLDLPEAVEALGRDIDRLERGTPSWLPEPVATAILAEPELAARVRALAN